MEDRRADGRTEGDGRTGDGPSGDTKCHSVRFASSLSLRLALSNQEENQSLDLSLSRTPFVDTINRSARQQPQPIFSAHNLWSGNEHLADDPLNE